MTTTCTTSADVIISGDVSPGPNDYTIGVTSEGSITVNNGSVVSDWNVLQIGAGALGTVTVTDPGTTISAVRFDLGNGSEGRFNLLGGASANIGTIQAGMNSTGLGSVSIDGVGSVLSTTGEIRFGNAGPAGLSIHDGGSLTSNGHVSIGYQGAGEALLHGNDSRLITTQELRIGWNSFGEMTISNGALAESHHGWIGRNTGASGIVTVGGSGSTWSMTGNLAVGWIGTDSLLTIEDGAEVHVDGTAHVRDSDLFVGGEGSLLDANGFNIRGRVTVDDLAAVKSQAMLLDSSSEVLLTNQASIESGNLTINQNAHLRIANGGIMKLTAHEGLMLKGALTLESGLLEFDNGDFVGLYMNPGTFTWTGGTLAGAHHFQDCGPIIQQGGTFQVGPMGEIGGVGMKVDYELWSDATLAIELAGEIAWENDQLFLYGAGATLAGKLDLSVLNEYIPEYGHQHSIVEMGEAATHLTGLFSTVIGVEFLPDRYLAVVYNQDSIDVIAALPGDANLDQSVDFNDLLAVAQNYQSGNISTWITGDFNGSGSVDFNDLLLIAQHYGSSLALQSEIVFDDSIAASFQADWQSALVSVPEPSGALVFAVMTLIALRRSAK